MLKEGWCRQIFKKCRSQRNETSKQIGIKVGIGATVEVEDLKSEVSQAKRIYTKKVSSLKDNWVINLHDLLLGLPNVLDISVPTGDTESDNDELRNYGKPEKF